MCVLYTGECIGEVICVVCVILVGDHVACD